MNLVWLGLLRLAPIWFSFLSNWLFHHGPCPKSPNSHGREGLLAVWSLITATVCFICAFKFEDGFLSRCLSFTFLLSLFATERLIYGRLGVKDRSPFPFFEGVFTPSRLHGLVPALETDCGIIAQWLLLFRQ